MLRLPRLSPNPDSPFPSVETALRDPDGLLAMGGDLSPARLINAYAHGIFPWFSEGYPILWWSPDPRMVFDTGRFRLSSRMRRSLRNSAWRIAADTAFEQVIAACAEIPRPGQDGTWINAAMRSAYAELHRRGYAHSVEVFSGPRLVGGIYGVAIGQMFFGESMFSAESGGSKVALAALCRQLRIWGWPLLDAQVENPHLLRLGAEQWPRSSFMQRVREQIALPPGPAVWSQAFGRFDAVELAGRQSG
ncbi:MAG: leucyl/phenylalanyl-tRNA--protein transferase [Xanthomonadaceae bacterium]|jgi:leucyl/phenylalanyl-tRNA--protein transferase|nr:leucyl/phenylalanyl-tRNA--protein transferase [Xanthomonadaceae bacterium]